MQRIRVHANHAAKLVLLLLALAVLAPTVSRALVYAQGQLAPWATLCVAQGAGKPSGGSPAEGRHLGGHCPACHLQTDHLVPAAAPGTVALPLCGGQMAQRPPQPAPHGLTPWVRAQPRAPPQAI